MFLNIPPHRESHMNKPKIKKADVNWIKIAPKTTCKSCIHVRCFGRYSEKARCTLYHWTTYFYAVCDSWQKKEADDD